MGLSLVSAVSRAMVSEIWRGELWSGSRNVSSPDSRNPRIPVSALSMIVSRSRACWRISMVRLTDFSASAARNRAATAAAPAKHIRAIATARASVRLREKPTLSACVSRGIHPDNMVGTPDLSLRFEGYILYPCVVNEGQFRQIDRGVVLVLATARCHPAGGTSWRGVVDFRSGPTASA